MEKLLEATGAMAKLELQMTKNIEGIRHALISQQPSSLAAESSSSNGLSSVSSPTTSMSVASNVVLPQRIIAIREARKRLSHGGSPRTTNSRGPVEKRGTAFAEEAEEDTAATGGSSSGSPAATAAPASGRCDTEDF